MVVRLIVILIFNLFLCTPVYLQEEHRHDHVHDNTGQQSFIENKGQWKNQVLFKNRFDGGNLWVEQHQILFQFQDYAAFMEAHSSGKEIDPDEAFLYKEKTVKLKFIGSNKVDEVEKEQQSSHYFNFFLGNDRSKWASGVRAYKGFVLKNIYDNIDLHFTDKDNNLKYEFIIQPNTSPSTILMEYENHTELKVDRSGNLIVKSVLGEVIEEKPYAYQVIDGKIITIDCKYQVKKNHVSYKLGNYNKDYPLIIDPTLVFATYNGAFSDNFGMTATYGTEGKGYMAGTVFGNSYPMPDSNVFDPYSNLTTTNNGLQTTDIFLTKYSADGTTMLWSTFFGGGDRFNGTEIPHSLISDDEDNIYLFGSTSSLDFPTSENAFQTEHAGGEGFRLIGIGADFRPDGTDIFVAKFSPNGHELLGSTYVGGSANDGVNYSVPALPYNAYFRYDSLVTNYGDQLKGEIMLDSENNVIVASSSRSKDFPVKDAFQSENAGHQDGVVFKLKNDFTDLIWSTYIGGSRNDGCYSVKLDSSENIVFAGGTVSEDFPTTTGAYQENFQGGVADGFISKISKDGQTLMNSTFVGTDNYDQAFFVEVDRNNNVFMLGQSRGGNFPVSEDVYSNPGSSQFVAKFKPDLSEIILSTVIGSGSPSLDIAPSAFLVDLCGHLYITGWGRHLFQFTPLSGMPVTENAFLSEPQSGFDFYFMVLEREMNDIIYGSYLGGTESREHNDGGTSRYDEKGVVYQSVCGGCGGNSDFPTTDGAWSSTNNSSNCNGLMFKFDFNNMPSARITVDRPVICQNDSLQLENLSINASEFEWDFGNGEINNEDENPVVVYEEPGVYEVVLLATDSICQLVDTARITIEVFPLPRSVELDSIEICEPDSVLLIANSFGTANEFIWSSNSDFSDTLNASILDSTASVFIDETQLFYIKLVNEMGCEVTDSVKVIYIEIQGETSLDILEICEPFELFLQANSFGTANEFIWSSNNDFSDTLNASTSDSVFTETITASEKWYYVKYINSICSIIDSIQFIDEVFVEANFAADITSSCKPASISIENLSSSSDGHSTLWDFGNETTEDSLLNPIITYTEHGVYEIVLVTTDSICAKVDTARLTITVFPDPILEELEKIEVCDSDSIVLLANSFGTAEEFIWSSNRDFTDTLNNSTADSIAEVYIEESAYYYIQLITDNGCKIIDSVEVENIVLELTPQLFLIDECVPYRMLIRANSFGTATDFLWSTTADFSDTLNATLQDSSVLVNTVLEQQMYYIKITRSICSITDSIEFENEIFVEAEFTVSDSIGCSPLVVNIENLSSSYDGYEFTWDFGNGVINDSTTNPTITYTEVGIYEINFVAIDSVCSLVDSATMTIEILPDPMLAPFDSISQCQPSVIPVVANSFGLANEFIWSSDNNFSDTLNTAVSDSTVEIVSESGGYFYVQASNGYCAVTDSIFLLFTSAALTMEADTALCIGDTTTVYAINLNDNITFDNYHWGPENLIVSDSVTQAEVYTLVSNYISVTAEADNGCIITDSILIHVSTIDTNDLIATASENFIPINTTTSLSVFPEGLNYSWEPYDIVYEPTAQTTEAFLSENTLFTVFVTDSICFLSAKVLVKVYEYVCDEPNLYIPNAFTPNGDGENDVLFVRSTIVDETETFIFRVFNRWGEKVFETNDINEGWDGTWRGKRLAPDVYDYYLEGFCLDGQDFLIQGNVTLIR